MDKEKPLWSDNTLGVKELLIIHHIMKKFLLMIFSLLCISAWGFDWKPQSNEALRDDMLYFAEMFAQKEKGTEVGKILNTFIREQKRKAKKQPYAWISDTKDVVLQLEAICPPVIDDGSPAARTRRDIFRLLDFPIHSDNRSQNAPEALKDEFEKMSESYRAQARDKVLKCLSEPAPSNPGELQVMKVYNCGIILRDSERTIAIDIKWEGNWDGAQELAAKTDAFFLSHPHRDHYSDIMIKALGDNGVVTVLPKDLAPKQQWEGKKVIHEDVYQPIDINGIETLIQAGIQKSDPNNLYILDFDGWRVMLPGESDKFEKLQELEDFEAPDLVILPSWNRMYQIFETISRMRGFDKTKIVCIPEHENEFTHGVSHRESYRELFLRKDRLGRVDTDIRPRILLLEIGENTILRK